MTNVIPFPQRTPANCDACQHSLHLGNGDVHCTVYNEVILEPAYAAEDCPTYEPN